MHNRRGAAILLGEGMGRLQDYRPEYQQVDLTALLTEGQAWLQWIQTHPEDTSSTTFTLDQPFPWPQIQYR
jgi:predicted metal-dependent hydrolase